MKALGKIELKEASPAILFKDIYIKALQKAASSVFCSFAKFKTQPVPIFSNVSKIFYYKFGVQGLNLYQYYVRSSTKRRHTFRGWKHNYKIIE
jgi:hypothetical protein